MDSPPVVDIFEIYRRYCDIKSQNVDICEKVVFDKVDELRKSNSQREALSELLHLVESTSHIRNSVFDELLKLMVQLDLMVDFSEFLRFYDFVFFMCRENGQKNITVSKAITAWRLVLAGRFRLLNQWCEFVEKNLRYNISEDTWQQVLAFSRLVHENLEGYDPEGAWPVVIDDFVEHMYRVSGSNENPNFYRSCSDSESLSCVYEDSLPGLRNVPGLKRKCSDLQTDEMHSSETPISGFTDLNLASPPKRSRQSNQRSINWEENPPGTSNDDCMEIVRPNSNSPLSSSSKSPCAVEGCLSRGFAGLFSNHLQFGRQRRVL